MKPIDRIIVYIYCIINEGLTLNRYNHGKGSECAEECQKRAGENAQREKGGEAREKSQTRLNAAPHHSG